MNTNRPTGHQPDLGAQIDADRDPLRSKLADLAEQMRATNPRAARRPDPCPVCGQAPKSGSRFCQVCDGLTLAEAIERQQRISDDVHYQRWLDANGVA